MKKVSIRYLLLRIALALCIAGSVALIVYFFFPVNKYLRSAFLRPPHGPILAGVIAFIISFVLTIPDKD